MRYTGKHTQAISFPLGGIGTGSIGLGGNGRLIDWEIKNRPNKNSDNGFSFFAIKAERDGRLLSAKALNGDLVPPFHGTPNAGYGYGPERTSLAGVPHFRDAAFDGVFPFARVEFGDEAFPGKVALAAFNPMIPSNADDSGIPAAFFSVEITNDTDAEIDYYVVACLQNAFKHGKNAGAEHEGINLINLTGDVCDPDDPAYGELALATDAEDASIQECWFRGGWFDSLSVFWHDFTQIGHLRKRSYSEMSDNPDVGALSVRVRVKAGQTRRVRFAIGWYFPNYVNYWNPMKPEEAGDLKNSWKNYYATRFTGAADAVMYALKNWTWLEGETRLFSDALNSTTIPDFCLDAISSTMSVLKTATCLRLPDGSFYGWEGMSAHAGSCEGSCTHVWNYAYALPFLYPALERTLRETDYAFNQDSAGGMHFRTQLPLGRKYWAFRPCADGQFGGVMKVYREWKISGDTDWLKNLWPKVKKSVEYAWKNENPDRWDPNKDGVLEGRQHHTLDMELFGPSGWLNGFYLGALKAAARMAEAAGDTQAAREYDRVYHSGRKWVDENLFNGEYYIQKVALDDREQLKPFGDAYDTYWNAEAGQIKYQIGGGSSIDQVTAQWHANNMGLKDILDTGHVKKALRFIYEHNFMSMRDHFNPCRLYSLNDEKGTVMCVWPEGSVKPVIPVPYAEETMYGFEYQAAVSLIQNGMIDEGLELVKAIRDRHDGEKRNPWNEMECGSNYARSMASYSILLSLSGFEYDMTVNHIGFDPVIRKDDFRTFWALDEAWGVYEQNVRDAKLKLLYGKIKLKSVKAGGKAYSAAKLGDKTIALGFENGSCVFDRSLEMTAGDELAFEA